MKVTLSENLQEYVWVAEIQQGTSPLVTELVSLPRPETAINLQSSPPLSIHIVPLISRPEPILDVVILEGNPRRLFALGAEQIVSHEFNDGRWVSGEALTIQHVRPFPRDLRGRLVLRKDHLFDAYLPG
ncbi:MAG TPA: hypothetical protein VFB00_05100, partial [Terriglobales bacterium]|nr:hypothetical protein [Terriglobales bacterium]